MIGKNGQKSSNHWKKVAELFQSLETIRNDDRDKTNHQAGSDTAKAR